MLDPPASLVDATPDEKVAFSRPIHNQHEWPVHEVKFFGF